MSIVAVTRLDDPRLADYRDIKDADSIRRRGVFIVESPHTVRRFAAGARFRFRSALLSERLTDLITELDRLVPEDRPIYTAAPDLMSEVVGFPIHRGCLAVGECGPEASLDEQLAAESPDLVVVMEGLSNVDNVGAIFRNAAAFGVGLVVVDRGCCDPLYRRSIRVSVGTTLTLPFVHVETAARALTSLRERGYLTVALTPDPSAATLAASVPRLTGAAKLALFAGTEGDGLGRDVLGGAELQLRIPMAPGVDSLNVATATAVVLYRIGEARREAGWPTEN